MNLYSMHSYLRNDFSDTRNEFSNNNMIDKKVICTGVVVAYLKFHGRCDHVLVWRCVVYCGEFRVILRFSGP
jgi:hypothetical protein